MREREPHGSLFEEAALAQLFEHVEHVVWRRSRACLDRAELDLGACDGCEHKCGSELGAERFEPTLDEPANGIGDDVGVQRPVGGRGFLNELRHVQGVPARPGRNRLGDDSRSLGQAHPTHREETADLVDAESPERDCRRRSEPMELGQCISDRRCCRPVRDDQGAGMVREPRENVPEECERVAVGPLEVVDHEDEVPICHSRQRRTHGAEQLRSRLIRRARRRFSR